MAEAAALVDEHALGDRPVFSAHPLLAYFLHRNPYDRDACPPVALSLRDAAPPGTLWFWESHYTPRPGADFASEALRDDPRWRYLGGVLAPDSTWAGAFFLRVDPGTAPPDVAGVVSGGIGREGWFSAAEFVETGAGYAARAAAADPGDAERWRVLADRLAASGRVEDARRALARAEEIAPGDPRNLAIEAAMLMDAGRAAEAEDAARRAFEARPKDPYLRFLYGRILWEQGRRDAARPLILDTVDRLEDRWDAQLLAGSVCLSGGDEAAAARHYRAALALNPGLVIAHFRLAQIGLRAGNPNDGIRHLRAVIDLQPESPQAYVLLGELYQRLQRPAEARAVWTEGLSRTGGDSTLVERLRGLGP
jgi:cytochrome c-type biogenesis protein CcmH/NrfG